MAAVTIYSHRKLVDADTDERFPYVIDAAPVLTATPKATVGGGPRLGPFRAATMSYPMTGAPNGYPHTFVADEFGFPLGGVQLDDDTVTYLLAASGPQRRHAVAPPSKSTPGKVLRGALDVTTFGIGQSLVEYGANQAHAKYQDRRAAAAGQGQPPATPMPFPPPNPRAWAEQIEVVWGAIPLRHLAEVRFNTGPGSFVSFTGSGTMSNGTEIRWTVRLDGHVPDSEWPFIAELCQRTIRARLNHPTLGQRPDFRDRLQRALADLTSACTPLPTGGYAINLPWFDGHDVTYWTR